MSYKLNEPNWKTYISVSKSNSKRTKSSKVKSKSKPRKVMKKKFWKPTHVSKKRILGETFVYVMGNFPYFFLNKFGISDHTKARTKNVSDTTPGIVFKWTAFNLAFGFEVEQFVHRMYKLQNVHFWTGSGRTEWFLCFSPIVGTLIFIADYHFNITLLVNQQLSIKSGSHILWLSFFTPFIWWDGLFWLLIFRAIKILALVFILVFLVYFLVNIK